jgi:zinc/manganese transport system permease protein
MRLAAVGALALACLAVVGRPLLFASIDEEVARARGVPTRALAVVFLLVLGLAVAATAQITGVLLVFALLIAPAATAQLITSRVAAGLALTVLLGVLTTWVGLALAYFYDYPVGFFITSVVFGLYFIARLGRALADRPRSSRRALVADGVG